MFLKKIFSHKKLPTEKKIFLKEIFTQMKTMLLIKLVSIFIFGSNQILFKKVKIIFIIDFFKFFFKCMLVSRVGYTSYIYNYTLIIRKASKKYTFLKISLFSRTILVTLFIFTILNLFRVIFSQDLIFIRFLQDLARLSFILYLKNLIRSCKMYLRFCKWQEFFTGGLFGQHLFNRLALNLKISNSYF